MDPTTNTNNGIKFLFMLIMVIMISSHSIGCPKKCQQCNEKVIECPSAGLTEIPKDIPLTVERINLSGNKLFPINRSYFLKFESLQVLFLSNCNLKGHIRLPKSLTWFDYSYNKITIESLKIMLNNTHSLKRFDMQWTNLNTKEILRILPRGIQYLVLNGNSLTSLGQDDLKRCIYLKEFHCDSCSLKVIEANAFDCVQDITHIVLSRNKLVNLPDKIFQTLKTRSVLDMTGNMLQQFNASKLGMQSVDKLLLGYNRINTIDLTDCNVKVINFANNNISRLDAAALGSSPAMVQASFERNRIREISQRTFENKILIMFLSLHENNITSIPCSLLRNTIVSVLFLHKNSLSNVDDFILGMKTLPNTLTLYSNKKLKHLNTSVFKGISSHSKIYVSCNDLNAIILSSKRKLSINCYSSSDVVLNTSIKALRYDGYNCSWRSKSSLYSCNSCQRGFYSVSDDRDNIFLGCLPCPAGSFYQDELASLRCKKCPVGQYVPLSRSPAKDASDCRKCPLGTNTSQLAGWRACRCLRGYYRRHRFGECEICRHTGFTCVRDYPQLKKGFWMTWNGTELSNRSCKQQFQSYVLNLETFNNSYDRNTMHFKCPLPIPIKCPMRGSCQGGIDSSCSSGYTGVLCGVCSEGYKRNFNTCVKCPQLYIIILRWIGLIMLFILLCYIVSDKKDDRPIVRWMSESNDQLRRSFVDIFISSFKILIGFYQTLIGVMNAYNTINWPSNLVAIISMMEYIHFEIMRIPSLRCINPKWTMDAVKEFWISFIIFITFPILCFICFLVRTCCLYYHETSDFYIKRKRNLCARNCVRIASLFVFITYPLMSARVTYILPASCDVICTVGDNEVCKHSINFLRSDYSLNCLTMSTHKYTLVTAYSFFVILCGLPLALWIVLRESPRKNGQCAFPGSSRQYVTTIGDDGMEEICDTEEESNLIDYSIGDERLLNTLPVLKCALRFTYENYKAKFWYWEVIEMERKLIMTTGAALFLHYTKIGLSTLIIVGIAFAILHAIKKPMKDNFENLLQMLSLWIIPINLSAGAVIQSSIGGRKGSKGNDPESWKVGMFLIVINSLLIALIVGRFAKLGVERIIKRVA